jgi:glutamate racemase
VTGFFCIQILSNNRPIGIFDSGIGGLTVAHAIQELLPNEQLIYFGDTAHLPYGDKSKESIISYSKKITRFLIQKNCKAIVIACNTASSFAYKEVVKEIGNEIPILNVIDPIVAHVKEQKYKNVGVIGTKGTIGSRIYPRKLEKIVKGINVGSLSTPLLCPMIEEGFFNNNISRTIINAYLEKKPLDNIEALILACTHYPLIKEEVEEYYNGSVNVIDSAHVTALAVQKLLKTKKLFSEKLEAKHHFYVSDLTDSFEKSTRTFFTKPLHLELEHLWAD